MKASKPYFSHDIATRTDEKIIRLMFDFKKSKKDFDDETLRELVSHAAYGLYWEIIEYLHENNLNINELDMLADDIRVDCNILKRILNNYGLFEQVEGKYISKRVLRNLQMQEEKSEKARQSANKRYGTKRKEPEKQKEEIPYNDEITLSIIQIYNKIFKKSQIVSNTNKQRIFDIHTKNNLSEDTWEKIFKNAKRGWDIGDKKNVPPSLKKILDEWDSFASDDYFLAPDREALARLRDEQNQEEAHKREQARTERDKEAEEYQKARNAITDKTSAISFIAKFVHLPDFMLPQSKIVRELSQKYNFTANDVIAARREQ